MTEDRLRQIIREELQAILGQQQTPVPQAGQVISLERRMEIKRKAEADMAAKRGRG